MKYSTIIFDMDGTILNTLEDLHDSVNYALEKMGYSLRSLDEIRRFIGNGVKVLIRRCVPQGTSDENYAECLEIFEGHYANNYNNKTRPYDGITDLLNGLRDKNIKTAVVSNKIEPAVVELCDLRYSGLFDCIAGQTDDRRPKPAPDSVLYALEKLGVSKEEAVYVGDTEVDVETAMNAGLDCIGVTWGFRDREALKKAGARYVIDKPDEMFDIVR